MHLQFIRATCLQHSHYLRKRKSCSSDSSTFSQTNSSHRSKWDHKDQACKLVAQMAAMQISVIQRLYCSLVITLNTDPAVTIYTCLFQTPLPWEKERIGICRPYISRVTCLLIGHIKLRGLHAWAMAARLLNSKQSAPPQSSHEIKSGAPEQVKCFFLVAKDPYRHSHWAIRIYHHRRLVYTY